MSKPGSRALTITEPHEPVRSFAHADERGLAILGDDAIPLKARGALHLTVQRAGAATPRQLLHLPRPRRRGSGLPSPVLKLAWQRMQTYIFELDIMGLTPGSALGRAAVYSAWVWRSLRPVGEVVLGAARRVAIVIEAADAAG